MKVLHVARLLNLFTVAFILSFVISCSAKPEDSLVGNWSEIGGTEKMELFKDGSIKATDNGVNMGGKYMFIERDKIKVELGGLGALTEQFVATVSVSGDVLTWTMPDGVVYKYRKEK